MKDSFRIEKDSLGEKKVPAEAYYGIQTLRAKENFPISGATAHPAFIEATVQIKKAAARTNMKLGLLDKKTGAAIVKAADEILAGKWQDQFIVDIYQAGAGTSHNMNANEVLANRALEILGKEKGSYEVISPNDQVNMAQSTNDVIPTVIRLASLRLLRDLLPGLQAFQKILEKKAKQFDRLIKSGRTHLQDATPIRLGQEFGGYAECIRKHTEKLSRVEDELAQIGLGGTAVGTGINAHPKYRSLVVKFLKEQTRLPLVMTRNYFESMQSIAPFVSLSGGLRNLAVDVTRIANDIRLLSSGPKTGFYEITLPAVQPGSSIMPGKVNPSIPEMVNQVCYQVMGLDTTVVLCAQAGQLELNVMMPVVGFDLCHMLTILTNAIRVFGNGCIDGIQANEEICRRFAENSMSVVTALNPILGYLKAAEVAKEALATGKTLREVILERKLMTEEKLNEVFNLMHLTEPGISKK